jgi:streptomycin 6-kinase
MDVKSRSRACQQRWGLSAVRRLGGGFRADVFASAAAAGDEVVVKLSATPEEARAEAAALGGWAATGAAVRLIDVDLSLSALLLAHVRPGTPLPDGNDAIAVDVAVDLLARLHRTTPTMSFPFPRLEEVYNRFEDQARDDAAYEQNARGDPDRGRAGLERLDAARTAAMALCSTTSQAVVLHGDFLDKNLLCAQDTYVAADPMPMLGDPCADIGFFAAGHRPAAKILWRAGAIAHRMGLDSDRARRWAAIWTVHQDCQSWRADQRLLDEALDSREFNALLPGARR